jgi:hypothetical protein
LKRAGHTDNTPADLHFGQPAMELALSRIDRRCLSFEYTYETGVGSQLSHHLPGYYAPRRQDLESVPAPLTLRVILEDSEKRRRILRAFLCAGGATGVNPAVMGAAVSLLAYMCVASARYMPSVVPQRDRHG